MCGIDRYVVSPVGIPDRYLDQVTGSFQDRICDVDQAPGSFRGRICDVDQAPGSARSRIGDVARAVTRARDARDAAVAGFVTLQGP